MPYAIPFVPQTIAGILEQFQIYDLAKASKVSGYSVNQLKHRISMGEVDCFKVADRWLIRLPID